MINSKKKGNRGEREYAELITKIFGCEKVKRDPFSGAIPGYKGDLMLQTLPPILQSYPPEIKYEERPRLFEYVRQTREEYQSQSEWHIAYRTPADMNIPGNFLVIMSAMEWLGLMKELQTFRENSSPKGIQKEENR